MELIPAGSDFFETREMREISEIVSLLLCRLALSKNHLHTDGQGPAILK